MTIIALILTGAAAYWVPIILTFALFGGETLVIANTAAITVSLLCIFVLKKISTGRYLSLWLLLGIYLFGPVLLMVAFSFIGGGFAKPLGWEDFHWLGLASIFPPIFWLFAGNGGLLPSLATVTAYHGYKAAKSVGGTGG